jgi:hypothetical protein
MKFLKLRNNKVKQIITEINRKQIIIIKIIKIKIISS